ncbi:hypothetical protein CLOP_g24479 [Closterium sp. NIES-67]|nr:hypothetical protein CLOP_g24479 [Closterium sp. NIES-67]
MQLYFRQIGLLKLMIGTEPRPKEMAEQADWDERSSAGYYLLSQSLELNQRHHIMHLLPEIDCGPKAWAVLKDLHAPTSVAASLMLDRELSMLRLSENEPVQPVLDKMRELYAKLAIAGITYPEQTKCLKMLSLLPESWLQFISGLSLPQNQSQWTLEWIRTKILEEDFRRYTLRGGDDSTSGYAMQGTWRDRGRGNRGRSYHSQGGRGTWNQRGRGGAGARGRGGHSNNDNSEPRLRGECWYCKEEGHPWFRCPTKPDWWTPWKQSQKGNGGKQPHGGANMVADPAEETSKDDRGMGNEERNAGQFYHVCDKDDSGTAVARAGEELHPLDMWVMDSGAAWTMTPRKDLLDAVRAPPISEVRSASGHAVKVAGVGRAAFRAPDGGLVVLKDVLLVPGLKANLISLRKLGQAGVSTTTNGSKTFKGLRGDRVLWDLHESRDVFRSMWQIPALIWESTKKELGEVKAGSGVQGECNAVSAAGVTVSARSGETDWETAHKRLGHVAMPLLQQLHKEEAVKGLKLSGQPNDTKCETCLLSKFTRFPFHGVAGKSKAALELVHMDLVGPFPVRGSKGERYFLTIVDDWSRLMWAYPLKQKDHAASTIRDDWLPFVERQSGHPCKSIRTDRGGGFLGGDLTAWLKKQGIEHQLTTSYTPQSNGVAERANRTILETARVLLIESGLGNSMWPHAVRHATVARNRVLTKVADDMWVPLERWLGKKPPVDMLRVFGCMAVAHVPKPYRTKLGASALWCVHLGLAAESKGWLLWEPSKNVLFDSRDVKFVENIMYGKWEKQPEARVTQQLEEITMHFDVSEPEDSEVTAPTASGTDEGSNEDIAADAEVKDPEQQQQEASKTPSLPKRRKQIGGGTKDWVKVKEWVNPTIYPARTRMATRKLLSSTNGGATTEQQEQAQGEDAVLFLGDDQESDDEEPAYCFYAPIQPPSMDHALAGPQRGKWLVSRDAEYNSQMENHTWDLVYLPNGKKAIQCKWLAKIKTDEKGEPSVYKSRLVAKGFQQKEKEDYKEVFAPTAKSPTLRVLLAVAAVRKWKVKQMDIVTVFLYGIVEEEVYMVQPPGYEDGTGLMLNWRSYRSSLKTSWKGLHSTEYFALCCTRPFHQEERWNNASRRQLPCPRCHHGEEQVSDSMCGRAVRDGGSHVRFQQTRSPLRLPSNSRRCRRHSQDGVPYSLRSLRVPCPTLRPHKRPDNIYGPHERHLPPSHRSFRFGVSRQHPRFQQIHGGTHRPSPHRPQHPSLFAKLSKCTFAQPSVHFLGHIISGKGISTNPSKIQAVADWTRPTKAKELMSFLGLAKYYRRFVHCFATICAPLTNLLRKDSLYTWSTAQDHAFNTIKQTLTTAPTLAIANPHLPYTIWTNASDIAIGAILFQDHGNGLQSLAYEFRKLQDAEQNYATHEREMLAIIHAIKIWHCYVEMQDVTVYTDHCTRQHLLTQPNLSRRQVRWLEFLEQYVPTLKIKYRPGWTNPADPLSCIPETPTTMMCLDCA